MAAPQKPDYKKIDPDPRYKSILLARFINYLMVKGKRRLSRKNVYLALDHIKKKIKKNKPMQVFEQAIDNVSPLLEVKSKRIGGANYQIPQEVNKHRRTILAMRWMVEGARSKSGSPIWKRLANEIMDAYNNKGQAVERKEESHRMAEANKAFAHYAKF